MDEENLCKFLKEIDMESVLPYLKSAEVTFESLKYLKGEDLKEAVPPLGLRVLFREKLFAWRKEEFGIDDDTLSMPSKVADWLQKQTSSTHSPASSFSIERNVLKRDFCYIPRKANNNASGKLFAKYKNKACKRRKLDLCLQDTEPLSSSGGAVEFDQTIGLALKTSLNRDSANWDDICDKWKKTFHMRQSELKELGSYEFLLAWSKLSHARAPELINIDFELLYPSKGLLLFSKWEHFKNAITNIYHTDIHNDYCKQLFGKAKSSTNKDAQDYLYTILLNAILPSTSRFIAGMLNQRTDIISSNRRFIAKARNNDLNASEVLAGEIMDYSNKNQVFSSPQSSVRDSLMRANKEVDKTIENCNVYEPSVAETVAPTIVVDNATGSEAKSQANEHVTKHIL
ncbi:uncharacterized protein [Eurosta solidaginis]|uniref:uncharacterized protein n=1 Tax=Eurosta solidaginis TaxID=178769 RepID=UPI003530948C